ncbi:MAG: dihydroorotate dehydrogenase electron transfer subunit [Promethearchaeota archaeon]
MVNTRNVINKPTSVEIIEKIVETRKVVSLTFKIQGIQPRPGQFFMVWIPDVDEIPMSVSLINQEHNIYGITVSRAGDATNALCSKEPKDLIGIRGPYGNGYQPLLASSHSCIIGGGVGIASLKPVIDLLHGTGNKLTIINAAKTEDELVYHDYFKNTFGFGESYFTSTDDGSCGEKCFGHELLFKLMNEKTIEFDKVYTCGPELMMAQVYKLCKERNISIEASLERMMRCGFGICGLCGLDNDGLTVCKDGPVFSGKQLEGILEFGKYHRDFSGYRHPF